MKPFLVLFLLLLFVFSLPGCGMKVCPDCQGKSFCSRCGGDGKCDRCGGTGHILDLAINDYRICPTCNGDKDCPKCDGKRVCPTCNGMGKISVWGQWRAEFYRYFMF